MKILRISLCNIASLPGTHTVDFTAEPLRSAGLFSISGATGAGKSSLLDAMCLALYDKTPRLKGLGNLDEIAPGERQSDPRSLLRRGCAEGMAEVAFEGVDQKNWLARWTVRRARRKADGKLQNVEMALFRDAIDASSEAVLEVGGKKTEVLEAIEQKLGLTFHQFTRAVLLAQNDFATFLKANDKDRAEILQALTGTEQFEAISRAVHERQSMERKSLEALEGKLPGAAPLSEEERTAAEEELKQHTAKVDELRKRVKQYETYLEWFRVHDERQAKLTSMQQHLAIAEKQLTDSQPRLLELQHTEIAQREVKSLRDALLTITETLKTAKKDHTKLTDACNLQQATLDEINRQHAEAQTTVAKQKILFTDIQKHLIIARAIDARLKPATARLREATKNVQSAKTAFETAESRLSKNQQQQKALAVERKTAQEQMQSLKEMMPFAATASHWLDRLRAFVDAKQSLRIAEKEFDAAKTHFETRSAELKDQEGQTKKLATAVEKATAAAKAANAAAKKFDAEKLAEERDAKAKEQSALSELKHYLDTRTQQRLTAETLQTQIADLEKQTKADAEALKGLQSKQLPQAEGYWQGTVSQLKAMQVAIQDDAKRLRTGLQDDQPCPVCGSILHPYQHDAPDGENAAIHAAEKSVADAEKKFQTLQQQVVKLDASLESQCTELARKKEEHGIVLNRLAETTFPFANDPAVSTVLALPEDLQLADVTKRLPVVGGTLQQIAANEKAQRKAAEVSQKCQVAFQLASEELVQHDKQLANLRTSMQIAESQVAAKQDTLKATRTICENAALPLQELWAAMPAAEAEFQNDPDAFQTTFAEQAKLSIAIQQRLQEITGEAKELSASMIPLQESMDAAKSALKTAVNEQTLASDDHDQQSNQRKQIFDGQPADAVETSTQKTLDTVVAALDRLTIARNEADKSLAAATKQVSSQTKLVQKTQTLHAKSEQDVQAWLQRFSELHQRVLTTDELDVLLSRDAAWLKHEQDAMEQLKNDVKVTEGALKELASQLKQHLESRPVKEDRDVVEQLLQANTEQLKVQEEERDGVNGRLRSDDLQKTNSAELTKQIQKKKLEVEPWLKLNELIGSADGAKFRSIAQRQTLDILLGYANVHLEQLSTRYRLERLPDCLNLIVVDLHMAEERRSVYSLSGGESFLVSLALALGLASLTSNRLRIESLFIDEGFGSLDPETLTVAMSALMHLEAQGRKVGVISHVAEMTDAIPIQIRILKSSNGASKVVVPRTTANENGQLF